MIYGVASTLTVFLTAWALFLVPVLLIGWMFDAWDASHED